MKQVIDPATILYGPPSWRRRAPLRRGWKHPLLVGTSIRQSRIFTTQRESGDLAGVFVEPTAIKVPGEKDRHLATFSWLESEGRFREHRYLPDSNGGEYVSWLSGDGRGWVGYAEKDGRQAEEPSLRVRSETAVELLSRPDGCWAIWIERPGDGYFELRCQGLKSGKAMISLVLDTGAGEEVGELAVSRDREATWVAWSTRDENGRTMIRASRFAPGQGFVFPMLDLATTGRVEDLKVAGRNGAPCLSWTDPESGAFFYADEEGRHTIGNGHPEWVVLPSGEVVFTWTDWMANDGLLFASLRGQGPAFEIESIQGTLPLRNEPESLIVGAGPDGSARICWTDRPESDTTKTRVFCQSVRDGIPEMPETLPGVWTGGNVVLHNPVTTRDRMILPIGHSTAAALSLWRSELL